MTWFINQSLLFIVLGFLLGLLVGYLWWGRQVRRIRTQETTIAPSSSVAAQALVAAAEPLPAEPTAADPVHEEPADAPAAVAVAEVEPADVEPLVETASAAEPADVEPLVETASAAEPALETVDADPVTVDEDLVADVESAFATGPAETPKGDDDLARIEGIGPKIAAALKAAGITTFAGLADAERSTVEEILSDANLRFAPSLSTWSRQARLLADGDEAGFKELTDRLIAGREVTPKASAPAPADVASTEVAVAGVLTEPEPEPEPEPVVVVEPEPEPVIEVAPVAEVQPVVEPEPVAEPEPVVVPAQAAAVEDGPADNLQRIEGIGPKMSAALLAAGIRTYVKLAESDVDTLRAAIESADLHFAPSIFTWARQARLLADGDEEAFADLTRRLVAGRDVGRV